MKYTSANIFSIFLLLIFSIGAYSYFVQSKETQEESTPVGTSTQAYLCNSDGRICPDGTIVGRSGLLCEFTSCPGVIPASGITTRATGILYGRVTLSPVCPVEYSPPKPECAPRSFVTEVTAIDEVTGTDVGAGQTTDPDGRFVMDLFSGTYIIKIKNAQHYPSCSDMRVKIYANASSSILIQCDSGIR